MFSKDLLYGAQMLFGKMLTSGATIPDDEKHNYIPTEASTLCRMSVITEVDTC